MLPQGLEHHLAALGGRQPRELGVGAEQLQPDGGDHSVQAEGRDPRLEGLEAHPIGDVDAAGVLPPAAEGLGQLGLAGPARSMDEDYPLQPAGQLQLVDEVVPADEPAHRRQQIPGRLTAMSRMLAELVQGLVQRQPGRSGAWLGLEVGEADVAAGVVDRDHPVLQRHRPLGAGPLLSVVQLLPAGGDRLPN